MVHTPSVIGPTYTSSMIGDTILMIGETSLVIEDIPWLIFNLVGSLAFKNTIFFWIIH